MSGKAGVSKGEGRVLSQAECLRIHNQRHATAAAPDEKSNGCARGHLKPHALGMLLSP